MLKHFFFVIFFINTNNCRLYLIIIKNDNIVSLCQCVCTIIDEQRAIYNVTLLKQWPPNLSKFCLYTHFQRYYGKIDKKYCCRINSRQGVVYFHFQYQCNKYYISPISYNQPISSIYSTTHFVDVSFFRKRKREKDTYSIRFFILCGWIYCGGVLRG